MPFFTTEELNRMPRSRKTETRPPQTIEITIVADAASNTIYAKPNNGNVFLGIAGDIVVWKCDQPFSIQFFELSGTGARLEGRPTATTEAFTVKLDTECTFFKYFVTVGKLVLDPYIQTDH